MTLLMDRKPALVFFSEGGQNTLQGIFNLGKFIKLLRKKTHMTNS